MIVIFSVPAFLESVLCCKEPSVEKPHMLKLILPVQHYICNEKSKAADVTTILV